MEKARDEDEAAAAAAFEEVVVTVRKDGPTLVAKDIVTRDQLTDFEPGPNACMCNVDSFNV